MTHIQLPTRDEFLKLSSHIRKLAGINLPHTEKNLILVAGRLQKLQRQGLCTTFGDLLGALDRGEGQVLSAFVFALTTNTTSFFRERDHFDFLKAQLPSLAAKLPPGDPLRVWCTPCSTGEEAYSIAMTCRSALDQKTNFRILATDINELVLRVAKRGEYPWQREREIPRELVPSCIESRQVGDERRLRMVNELRQHIQFGQFNLLLDYPFQYRFDAIFCRNVLIYFEPKNAEYVVTNLRNLLRPGGYLFLGHSETSAGNMPGLKRIGPAIYVRE